MKSTPMRRITEPLDSEKPSFNSSTIYGGGYRRGCRFFPIPLPDQRLSIFSVFRKAVHANGQLFCSLGPQDRENRQPLTWERVRASLFLSFRFVNPSGGCPFCFSGKAPSRDQRRAIFWQHVVDCVLFLWAAYCRNNAILAYSTDRAVFGPQRTAGDFWAEK